MALNITERTLVYNMGTETKRLSMASVGLVPVGTQSLSSLIVPVTMEEPQNRFGGYSKEANLQIWNPPI